MATLFSSSLVPDANLASSVIGWASFFEAGLTNLGGWTVTSDTGQTPPSSLLGATAANQILGYRIYQMNDSFSADNPIYMRVNYGSARITANPSTGVFFYYPGITTILGTGTDGAGHITGLLWDGKGWNVNAATLEPSNSYQQNLYSTRNYASGDSSRFAIGLFVNDIQNPAGIFGSDQICFSLERTRDETGVYTGDGILITYTDTQLYGGGGLTGMLSATKYLICNRGGRAQPPLEKGLSYPMIRHSPAYSFDGTIPCALHCHFRGMSQQPGSNIVIVGQNDLALEGQFQINLYGQNHVYQHLRYLGVVRAMAGPVASASGLGDTGARVCIRYD